MVQNVSSGVYFVSLSGSSGARRWGGQFGDSGAVFARIGGPIIDAGTEVTHDRLAAAERVGIAIVHLEEMTFGFQLSDGIARKAVFQVQITTRKREFGKARRFHGRLDILVKVSDAGDVLGVGLRLVPSAHDAEGYTDVIF